MKKSLFFTLILFCISASLLAQDNENQEKENDRKFSIGLIIGTHTQQLENNNEHLSNLTSSNLGLTIDYQYSDSFYLKSGITNLSTVSITGLSYKSYIIPFVVGTDMNFINDLFSKSYNSDVSLLAEFGFYYKGIYDFQNSTSVDYNSNNVYGVQASLGVKYDVSDIMFTIISVRVNNDTDDILTAANNTIRVENSYGLELGFGFKF